MVFLINANLGPEAVRPLVDAGHEVIYATDRYPSASDEFLRNEADRNGWTIVTQDKGFSQAARKAAPIAGLITLRLRKQSEAGAAQALAAFLQRKEALNLQRRSVIIGDGGRVRG